MVAERITGAVVVAHSLSGVWAQLLLGAAPERIARMVFLNAVLLRNGESFVSNAVGPAQVRAARACQLLLPTCACCEQQSALSSVVP